VTTARETLLLEIAAMCRSGVSSAESIHAGILELLKRYRVQTKPRTQIPPGVTARDALAERLLGMWRQGMLTDEEQLNLTIDAFRMQHKKAAGQSKTSARKKVRPREAVIPGGTAKDESSPAARPTLVKSPEEPLEDSESRSRGPISSPVAGGPRKKAKKRAECPKCHSMGVVLARNYAGDDYYSCVYCGWQGYKPVDKPDFNVPVATQLLGQDGPKRD
jgi:hypothetical protein